MSNIHLNQEQEAEAQRLAEIIGQKAREEALEMARILVSRPDSQLLGAATAPRAISPGMRRCV